MSENRMKLQASTEDFIRVFESNLSKKSTYKEAYEASEREHEKITGNRRYSDYESFRTVRSRIKNRKK